MVLPRLSTDYDNTYVHQSQELMKAVDSHDNLALLFLMKVMVWDFVSNSHEVMTALIKIASYFDTCSKVLVTLSLAIGKRWV
jgi:hypothetical protein